jgi:hypothetical protein
VRGISGGDAGVVDEVRQDWLADASLGSSTEGCVGSAPHPHFKSPSPHPNPPRLVPLRPPSHHRSPCIRCSYPRCGGSYPRCGEAGAVEGGKKGNSVPDGSGGARWTAGGRGVGGGGGGGNCDHDGWQLDALLRWASVGVGSDLSHALVLIFVRVCGSGPRSSQGRLENSTCHSFPATLCNRGCRGAPDAYAAPRSC